MSSDITNGQNRQSRRSRPAAKPAKPKDGREKITLLISKETNVKLSTLAALKGVDRSTLADSILTEALRGVVISLRGAGGRGRGGRRVAGGGRRRGLQCGLMEMRPSGSASRRRCGCVPVRYGEDENLARLPSAEADKTT